MADDENLQSKPDCDILELETAPMVTLEVDGRFLGEVNVLTGYITLYHRGKRSWISLADERRKLGLIQ